MPSSTPRRAELVTSHAVTVPAVVLLALGALGRALWPFCASGAHGIPMFTPWKGPPVGLPASALHVGGAVLTFCSAEEPFS